MPKGQPYLFGSYNFTIGDSALTTLEQLEILSSDHIRGRPFPHRIAKPTADDADTLEHRPKNLNRRGFPY
jgi:hypothetical protein